MVTLGSMHPDPFHQAYHHESSARPYEDALNFDSLELALDGVYGETADPSVESTDVSDESHRRAARRGSVLQPPSASSPTAAQAAENSRSARAEGSPRRRGIPSSSSITTRPQGISRQSSVHRLFRTAAPELQQQQQQQQQQWHASHHGGGGGSNISTGDEDSAGVGGGVAPMSGGEAGLRSSWHLETGGRQQQQQQQPGPPPGLMVGFGDRVTPKGRGPDDREIMDGSDVLQQISNLTSTEPSNEREVFVGGLRESEDAVHITEEELATYFAKFGVIESVSINRDDRTQRGRGFAFVKFFQESAALSAVSADAAAHVIRGVTVSVQWSRGAKDAAAGGDRPRRRSSATSSSSGNCSSSSPASGRSSSSKLGMFVRKGGGGRATGGGSSSGGACGVGCSHGFGPMRRVGGTHMHPSSGGAGVPYGFGDGPHGEHQPLVCVVVPVQRAAALGLAPHPVHDHVHSTGSCASRGRTTSQDSPYSPLAQSSAVAAGGGGQHLGYTSHTRSQSSGGGGYGSFEHNHHHHGSGMMTPHHVSSGGSSGHHLVSPAGSGHQHFVSPSSVHHVSPSTGRRSYGTHPLPMRMPLTHREGGRGRIEPRSYLSSANSGGLYSAEYERSAQQPESLGRPGPYVLPEWGYDDGGEAGRVGGGMSASHGALRSQSPPTTMRRGSVPGGGVPRPPSASPRAYDGHYSSTRYNSIGADGFAVGGGGGIGSGGVATRRRSESSAMIGRSSIQRDALAAAASYHYSVDDTAGNTNAAPSGHAPPPREEYGSGY